MLESAQWLCFLHAALKVEQHVGLVWKRMSASRQTQPFQCRPRVCRDGICLYTRRRLTVDKSSLWPCMLNFLFCYKALISRFAFPPLMKSEFKAEPEAQDTSCYSASCLISSVGLLVGWNRITSHLFPVRMSVIGFSQLPSRSSWAGIPLRTQVPRFQSLNVVSGLLEI